MSERYRLYGWHLSYYSAKVRAYLRFKQLPFDDVPVNAWTLLRRIPRRTGTTAMPVVVTPQNEWLQDSTAIIESLEERHPERPALPESPRQRLAAMLIELWSDEFWVPPALHFRWSHAENERLFLDEAGRALLPWAPAFLGRRMAQRSANLLRSYLPGVGVTSEQQPVLERWTLHMLDALEEHFSAHDYLLGGRPTLADFALIGPLYAHLGRDPWPKRELIAPRPRLATWIARVHDGDDGNGTLPADDSLPATLGPVLTSISRELLPMVAAIRDRVREHVAANEQQGTRLPRMLPPIRVAMADGHFQRGAMPYTLWMLQRVQAAFAGLEAGERQRAEDWLLHDDGTGVLDMDTAPALRRKGLRAELA